MGLSAARRSEVDDWFQMLESDRPRPSPAPSAVICPSAGLRSGRTPVRAWSGQYGATWWQPGQRQEDLWFPLLRRRPSLPFIPSVEAVKQPVSSARLGYANRSSVERLLQPAFNQRDDWYQYFNPSFTIKQQETRPSSSLASSITSSLAQARSEDVKGGVVRDSEFIERWQEALGLVDELREMEDLEHRLRGVRDLEDRLQEVDELAERIQEVIEEELGREEVEKMAQEEEVQPERSHVEMELAETLEVGEVDELEDEIKRVFFGEREVEERFKSGSLDDDVHVVVSQRKVRKTVTVVQESWQEQAETESASVSVEQETQGLKIERDIRTTSVFEEKGFKVLLQEDGFNIPLQEEGFNRHLEEEGFNRHLEEEGFNRHLEEEGFNIPPQEEGFNIPLKEEGFNRHLEEEGFNRHLEEEGFNIPPQEEGVNITPQEEGFNRHLEEEGFNIPLKEEGFNRHLEEEGFNMPPQEEGFNIPPQKEGFNIPPQESQVEDNDVWFRLFDRLPYKAVSKPQAASTVPAEEYFTSKSITTKVLEMKTRGPQVLVDELSPAGPQVLVDELSPAGTQVLVDELSPAGTQVLVDEMSTRAPQVLVDEMSTRGAEVSGGWEDVWFILLDVIPRGTPFVPPGVVSHLGNVFALVTSVASNQEPAKQSYSSEMIKSPAVEDEREVMVVEERLAPEETRGSPVILEVLERVADDWFVLFQVTPRKTTYVSPVATAVESDQKAVELSYPTETAGPTVEDQRQVVVNETILQQQETAGSQTIPAPLSVAERVEDDWFVLFNRVPRKTTYVTPGVVSHLGNVFALVTSVASDQEPAKQSYSSEMIQSPAVEDEREVMVEEERLAPEETRGSPDILEVLERVADDWFVLFQVTPRKTTYVSPADEVSVREIPTTTAMTLIEKTTTDEREEITGAIVQKIEMENMFKYGTETQPALLLKDGEDDWFVLLDVGSRAPSAVPPGSPVFLPVALKDLSRRVTTVAAVETIESVDRVRWTSSPVVTVEEVLQKQEERPPRQSIPEQAVPTREPDDWFVLLDVVPREVTYIAPAAPSTLYPEVSVTLQIVTEKAELTPQLEDIPRKRGTQLEDIPRKWGTQLEDILQLSAQPPPERDDSWFVLFDAVLIQPVTSPLVSSQSSGVEGRTTGTWQKVIIVEERRREETSLSDVQVTRYPSERKGGDEWFSLFDASRVSPVTRVAEVQGPMAGTALRGPSQEERAVVMEKKTVVMEERVVVMEERRPQEPTVSESEYGVVWHMLFQRVGEASRKMPTVERVRVSPKERASEGVPAVEQIPSRGSAVRQIWQQEAVPQPGNEVEDDWFVLLDVAPRKPVATAPQVRFYPDVRPATKATLGPAVPALRPLTPAVTALRPLAPAVPAVRPLTPAVPALRPRFSILAERLPAAQLREAVDDWFVLLDAVRTESVAAVGSHRGVRPVSAPVFSQAALAEAGLPLFPLDLPQTSTPLRSARQEERRLEVTMEAAEPAKGEAGAEDKSEEATSEPVRLRKRRAKRIEGDSIYIRHSLLMLEELEKPQEELLRHHASVSELKRNFMQAVPDSRPSEWDKRLSTHSPFRTAGANGGPGTDGITSDGSDGDKDSSTTFSSESGVTTTTTHISKVVKSGSTETRVEKRIVISAESEVEEGNDGTSM
ncbi:uncharacterized protein LOC132460209 isoform X4 [Gadus macrocephalus]|uniref:uncharacterized protein LOC132460209 isoform X4 n=1 Tax=Gadus macrocephalus TaxID=80720 RepID=UPI0028CB3135|nr:uncharacterized protein LOC132460209 isoform X4 [Gadus macrocephalus]